MRVRLEYVSKNGFTAANEQEKYVETKNEGIDDQSLNKTTVKPAEPSSKHNSNKLPSNHYLNKTNVTYIGNDMWVCVKLN